ncbi:MAG: hypothetical protein JXL80_14840 [Planctomycetes bacterium]|nr:hypothetical protein [Planctomycetota bacterium]
MGDMGIAGKIVSGHRVVLKVLGAAILVALAVGTLSWASSPTPRGVVPAGEVLPDTGRQFEQTNARLDEVTRQLREVNAKLEALQGILTSGKVVVTVKEAPAAAKRGEGR